jgi:hypothetical protein
VVMPPLDRWTTIIIGDATVVIGDSKSTHRNNMPDQPAREGTWDVLPRGNAEGKPFRAMNFSSGNPELN